MTIPARDGPHPESPSLNGYVLAAVLAAAAVGVGTALEPVVHTRVSLFVGFVAVITAALYLGLGPGVLAVLVGTSLGIVLDGRLVAPADHMMHVVLFGGIGTAIAVLGGRYREISRRAEARAWSAGREVQAVMQAAPLAITVLDEHGRVEYWSPGAERLLGWKAPEVVGKPFPTIPLEKQEEFRKNLAAALEGRTLPASITTRLKKSGPFDAAIWGAPVRDESGGRRRVVSVVADITEEVRAQRELAESRERLELAIAASGLIAWTMDLRTRRVFCSDRAMDIWGISEGEVSDFQARIHPDDRDVARRRALEVALGRRAEVTEEYRVVGPDGHVRWLRSVGRVRLGTDGQPEEFSGVSLDFTKEREAAEALRLSEERFRLALGNEALTVYEQDLELRYTWLYPVHPDFPERVIGSRDEDLVPDGGAAELTAVKRRVLESGIGARTEVRVKLPAGERWYDLVVEPKRDQDGHVIGVAGTALDITARKRFEEQVAAERSLLRQVLDQMPMGVMLVEAGSGRVLLRNEAVAKVVRGEPAPARELADLAESRAYKPDGTLYRPEEWPLSRALVNGEVVQAEEMGFHRADGVIGTLRTSAAPIVDHAGHRVAAVTVFEDVTERRSAEEFVRFLAKAGEVLASSLDYHTTLAAVARLAVPQFADWCAVDLLREDGTLERVSVQHVDPEKVRLAHELHDRYPVELDSEHGVFKVLRTGEPDYAAEIPDELLVKGAKDAEHLEVLRALGLKSYVAVPLTSRGRTLGVLTLVSAESGRVYGPDDVARALDLGRRAALAVDSAQLYRAAQEEIEERRRVERQIQESEERFRAMFEQSPLAKQIFRLDGTCIAANPAWGELWDAPLELVQGYNILHDPVLERGGVAGDVRRAFAGEVVHLPPLLYDPREIDKAGRARHVKASLSPVRDSGGKVSEVVLVLEDVTDRIMAEQAVRESEERLRIAVEAGQIGTWDWDIRSGRVKWSPQMYELYGLGPTDFGGSVEEFHKLVHPEDLERVKAALERSLAGEGEYALEFRSLTTDGGVRWLWTRGKVLRDAQGEPVRMIGASLDITERKQRERELRESELRYRLVNRATNDVIWEWDLVADRLQWNEMAEAAFGWSREEMGDSIQAWSDRIHPEDRERVVEGIQNAIDGGLEIWTDEYRFLRKDGTYARFLDRGIVARDGERRPVRMIGTMIDLTERLRAEEALKEAYQRLNMVLTSITDGYIALDTQFRFLAINPAAQRLVYAGRAVEEMLGRGIWELYPGSESSEFYRQYHRAMGEQVDVHFEAPSAITGRWFEAHGYPRPWGLEVYVRDITERKRAEEDLERQAQELARSNKELQDFAYVASHDLKEPLRGISTYAEILKEDCAERLSPDETERVETITRLSKRMYGLLDALLDYSRIGRGEHEPMEADLTRVVADAVDSLRSRLDEERAEVVVIPGLPCVQCDRIALVQVFTNLIANSLKYNSSPNKRVEIGCAEVRGEQAFFVRDNGIGIPPQHHERIFHMFKRLHKREEYGGGMGAGLAIVKKIVEQHGGRIWVESEPGHGATFWFTLSALRPRSVRVPGAPEFLPVDVVSKPPAPIG